MKLEIHARNTAVWVLLLAALATPLRTGGAPPGWRCEDASVRVFVSTEHKREHVLQVPLPVGLGPNTLRGAAAFDSEGTPLPCSLFEIADGRPRRLEVQLDRRQAYRAHVSRADLVTGFLPLVVYLLPERESPLPIPDSERLTVGFSRTVEELTTRPFSTAEFMAFSTARPMRYRAYSEVEAWVPAAAGSVWAQPPEEKVARLHWFGELFCVEGESLRIGADQDHVAWFVLFDGAPVAGWQEGEANAGGGRLSAALTPDAGLHRIDLFAIQVPGEPLPQLLLSLNGSEPAPPPRQRLASPHCAPALTVQDRGQAPLGYLRTDPVRYWDAQTGHTWTACTVAALPDGTGEDDGPRLRLDRRPAWHQGFARVTLAGNAVPGLTVSRGRSELGIQGRCLWPDEIVRLAPRVVLEPVPAFALQGSVLTLYPRIEGLPQPLVEGLQRDAGFELVTTVEGQEGEQGIGVDVRSLQKPAILALSVPRLQSSDTVLRTTLRIDGLALGREQTIHLASPGAALERLVTRGERLFLGDTPLILTPQPLAMQTLKAPDSVPVRVLICDDFLALTTGPGADLLPEKELAVPGIREVQRVHTQRPAFAGTPLPSRKLALIPELAPARPDVVIWAVGAADQRAGTPAGEFCLQLLFLAQHTAAIGAVPVLVTLPELDGARTESDQVRRTALLVKELGAKLGIPVLDLYSAARLASGNGTDNVFQHAYEPEDGPPIGLFTPANRGRRRVCAHIDDLLDRVVTKGFGSQSEIR
jgi:hypothetical protein